MFSFGITEFPNNNQIINAMAKACESLYNKLENLNISSLDISEYNKNYLTQMIGTKDGKINTLRKYAHVLSWAISNNLSNYKDITLLDYGGGHGLLAILASELGINNIVLNDIYPPSVNDAQILSNSLNCKIEHFIAGDLVDVQNYLNTKNMSIDVITNYDTIEHIYDIDHFLKSIHKLGPNLTYSFASGANKYNPAINRSIKKIHYIAEFIDRDKNTLDKKRDSVLAYINIRKNIIKENFTTLSHFEIDTLSNLTRGKVKSDILNICESYIKTKKFPKPIKEKTDTCDPITGNWAEHLLNPFELNSILTRFNFSNQSVRNGFYGQPKGNFKKVIGLGLNIIIKVLPIRLGLYFAPYYIINGTLKNDEPQK